MTARCQSSSSVGEKVIDGWTVVSLFILAVIIGGFIWALSADGSNEIM